MIGRAKELAVVRDAIVRGRSVVVVGAAGVGKTTLVTEAFLRSGATWSTGAAVDYTEALPYLPLTQVLGRRPTELDGAAVVGEVLDHLAGRALFVDDCHWADDDTIACLPELAARTCVVATCRPGTRRGDRVTAALDGVADIVELTSLAPDDARLLVQQQWPNADGASLDRIVQRAGGNPLALRVIASSRTVAPAPQIDSLQAVVEGLDHAARIVLARAGLRDVTLAPDTAEVDDLCRRGLVRVAAGRVEAEGDILGEFALASLSDAERADIHRRVAESTNDPALAARHWLEAGEWDRAHRAAAVAARETTTGAARAELLKIVAATAPEDIRWDTAREATEAFLRVGRLDEAARLLAKIADDVPDDPAIRIEVATSTARVAVEAGDAPRAVGIIDEVLTWCPDDLPQHKYWALAIRAGARGLLFDFGGATADAEAAIAVAQAAAITHTRATSILALIKAMVGDAEGFTMAEQLLRDAETDPEPQIAFQTGMNLLSGAYMTANHARAVALGDRLRQLAATLELPRWDIEVRSAVATHEYLMQPESRRVVTELQELAGNPLIGIHRPHVAAFLALSEADRGEIEAADRLLADARPSLRERSDAETIEWARAEVAWLAGRPLDCLAAAERAAGWAFSLNPARPMLAVLGKWGALESGTGPEARPAPMTIFRGTAGLANEAAALDLSFRGQHAEAAQQFLEAADLHDSYLRRCAFRCRWAAGENLRLAGEPARALEHLIAVAVACETAGFVPLAARARASLRQLGFADTAEATGLLSRRQTAVLELVAAGLTTQEIAARLRIQPSTVETHIRTAMKRLGAKTRREAASRIVAPDDRRPARGAGRPVSTI